MAAITNLAKAFLMRARVPYLPTIAFTIAAAAVLQAQAPPKLEVLHNFEGLERKGAFPLTGVVRDRAGNLYGTTYSGGSGAVSDNFHQSYASAGFGVVFKVDQNGEVTILHRFSGGTDGAYPNGLTIDSSGNLYGSTLGLSCCKGTIFKLDAAGKFTLLYTFVPGNEGTSDPSNVSLDAAGNLYGTTAFGGTNGWGIVFKLDTKSKLTVLYSFDSGGGDNPHGGVTLDSAGNVYGTATNGGSLNAGVVYRIDPQGHESVLYNFGVAGHGAYPAAGVILDSAGNIYGTASQSQIGSSSSGLVYKLDPTGHDTVLYAFTTGANGSYPNSKLSVDSAGNFYGTTASGGTNGAGVVFQLDSSGHEAVLYSLPASNESGPSMQTPSEAVILDGAGNLYGTAELGGADGIGSVFQVNTAGVAATLYSFPNDSVARGTYAGAGIILDATGHLYGTTEDGGAGTGPNTCGVVYQLDATGQETVLYTFPYVFPRFVHGCNPEGTLARDQEGNVYGTTFFGGNGPVTDHSGDGIVYKLSPSGQETILHSFQGGSTDGLFPAWGVIRDGEGNLYGTASGGPSGGGIVFKLDAAGNETVLFDIAALNGEAADPEGLIRDGDGNLYGVTLTGGITSFPEYPYGKGMVYRLDPSGHGTVLHMFVGGADGAAPVGTPVLDGAGNLYGTTQLGGTSNSGVIYKVDPAGNETVLYSFTGGADGRNPLAGVIRDAAGNLFGTTQLGGDAGYGVAFKLDPRGVESVLHSFTGVDGAYPAAGLQADSAENLYGTTAAGGAKQGGVVFKLLANPYSY